jgi:hypothetical protein
MERTFAYRSICCNRVKNWNEATSPERSLQRFFEVSSDGAECDRFKGVSIGLSHGCEQNKAGSGEQALRDHNGKLWEGKLLLCCNNTARARKLPAALSRQLRIFIRQQGFLLESSIHFSRRFFARITGLFDLARAAKSTGYCDEVKGVLSEAGVQLTELSTHLQGQLIAVHPAYDVTFDGFAAPEVRLSSEDYIRCTH